MLLARGIGVFSKNVYAALLGHKWQNSSGSLSSLIQPEVLSWIMNTLPCSL